MDNNQFSYQNNAKFQEIASLFKCFTGQKRFHFSHSNKKVIWHLEILFSETYRIHNCIADAHWKEVMIKIYSFTGSWKQIFINSETCSYNLSMQLTEKR